MPEQRLDLAQVGPGAEQLGGEHVPELCGVTRLRSVKAGGAGVAEEGLGEDRARERRPWTPTNRAGSGSRARTRR